MAGITDLLKSANVLGTAGNALGAVANTIGAFGQKKLAKQQLKEGNRLADQQRLDYQKTYGDLMSLAQGQETYKGDLSAYNKAEQEAKRQQLLSNINPADQIAREQVRQSTSNYIEQASRGARSGSDLMALAGIGAGQEAASMQNINLQSANQRFQNQNNANSNLLNMLSQTAAATAREKGLEFNSRQNKFNDILGLTKEQGLGSMDLNYQLNQEKFAREAAFQDSKSAIWSGFGDVFRAVGSGLNQQNMFDQQMKQFGAMYGNKNPFSTPNSIVDNKPNAFDNNSNPVYIKQQ